MPASTINTKQVCHHTKDCQNPTETQPEEARMAVDEHKTVQSFHLPSVVPRAMGSSAQGQAPRSAAREPNSGEALLK